MLNLIPENTGMSGQEYSITHLSEIEDNPIAYADFQKDDSASSHRQTAPLRPTAPTDSRCQLSQDGSWLPQAP